jgi:hypothetical protein
MTDLSAGMPSLTYGSSDGGVQGGQRALLHRDQLDMAAGCRSRQRRHHLGSMECFEVR